MKRCCFMKMLYVFLGLVFLTLISADVKSLLEGTFLLALVIPMSQHHFCSSEKKNKHQTNKKTRKGEGRSRECTRNKYTENVIPCGGQPWFLAPVTF